MVSYLQCSAWKKVNVKEQEQTEAVVRRCSIKKVFLEISQNSQENICVRESLNKVSHLRPATLFKKTLAQVFSCEFCEIYKSTFFHRAPLVAASEFLISRILLFSL